MTEDIYHDSFTVVSSYMTSFSSKTVKIDKKISTQA